MSRQPLRVLAIGAHPDDLEFYCGGTLARYAERGDTVVMAVVTNGDIGSATHSMEEIGAIGKLEVLDSAALIGAELVWMDYHDEFFFYNEETRRHMIEVIRMAEPDVVLGHWTDDYHPDHSLSGMAARDARIMTAVPLIVTAIRPSEEDSDSFFLRHGGRHQLRARGLRRCYKHMRDEEGHAGLPQEPECLDQRCLRGSQHCPDDGSANGVSGSAGRGSLCGRLSRIGNLPQSARLLVARRR